MQVIGTRRTDFIPKGETEPLRGYSVYVVYQDEKVQGTAADKLFVTDVKLDGYVPHVGDEITPVYNKYGKIDRLVVG